MTREECINSLKWHKSDLSIYDSNVAEAIDMAISALSAEPKCYINGTPFSECGWCEHFNCDTNKCEPDSDLISRAEAIKALSEYYEYSIRMVDEITDLLNSLPSVSAERVGEWIKDNITLTSNPPQYRWHCSECGHTLVGYNDLILTNYCSECGAKMENEK